MSDKVYIGRSAIDLNSSPALEPISRVRLVVGGNQEYVAGNTTGRTIEIECPWGTQEMADDLLSSLGGYSYQPLDVTTAWTANPLWELGDGVTVGGLYSQIVSMPTSLGLKFTADVNAPESKEINHEYPYQNKESRAIERKIAQTRASLRIDVDEIEARVDGLDGDFAALDIRVDGISSEVQGKIDGEEAMTLIEQGIDNIRLYASGEDGVAYISIYQGGVEIDGDSFVVNVDAANINGLLTADQIDTDGLTVGKLGDDDGDYAEMDSSGFSIYIDDELKTRIFASSDQVIWRLGLDNPGLIIKEYTSGSGHTLTLENASQSCWLQLNFTNNRIAMNASGGLWLNGRQIAS